MNVNWAATRQNQQNDQCPAKSQISLDIRRVWYEYSLASWRKSGPLTTYWAHREDFDQTGRIWVFAGRTSFRRFCRAAAQLLSETNPEDYFNQYLFFPPWAVRTASNHLLILQTRLARTFRVPFSNGEWFMSRVFYVPCERVEDSVETARKPRLVWTLRVCMRSMYCFQIRWFDRKWLKCGLAGRGLRGAGYWPTQICAPDKNSDKSVPLCSIARVPVSRYMPTKNPRLLQRRYWSENLDCVVWSEFSQDAQVILLALLSVSYALAHIQKGSPNELRFSIIDKVNR